MDQSHHSPCDDCSKHAENDTECVVYSCIMQRQGNDHSCEGTNKHHAFHCNIDNPTALRDDSTQGWEQKQCAKLQGSLPRVVGGQRMK